MTAAAAVQVLELLERAQVQAWVDGGWGVDALLGRQTRPHGDLDLVIPAADVVAAHAALTGAGFTVTRDLLPTAIAYVHQDGREVDLHPVRPTPDGGGDQDLSGDQNLVTDRPFHYGPPIDGWIAGAQVLCVDGETQLRAHSGYVPDAEDLADVAALVEHLGSDLPEPTADPSGSGSWSTPPGRSG